MGLGVPKASRDMRLVTSEVSATSYGDAERCLRLSPLLLPRESPLSFRPASIRPIAVTGSLIRLCEWLRIISREKKRRPAASAIHPYPQCL